MNNTIPKLIEDGSAYSERTIGGTGMSAVIGVNPYFTQMDLWLRVIGAVNQTPDNRNMILGRRYEPIVADMFQGANEWCEVRKNFSGTDAPCRVQDPEYDFITGSPDRILFDGNNPIAGLEIKTANVFSKRKWGESGTNEVPVHYMVQCMHYMGLTGLHDWKLAVLFLDDGQPNEYRSYNISFDEEVWSYMREEAVKWWKEYVEQMKEPPMYDTVGDTTIEYFRQKYPTNTQPIAEATEDEAVLMARLFDTQNELKALEARLEAEKTQLMSVIGEREGIYSPVGKITWKTTKGRYVTDWKSVAEEMNAPEEIVTKHTTQKEGVRMFRATPSKQ